MQKRIVILPLAEQDIRESTDYYRQIRDELKLKFLHALDDAFNDIQTNPLTCP